MWTNADDLGKLLFGRPLRLRVLLWVRGTEAAFFQAEAASGVTYSAAAVTSELDRLVDLEMVRRFSRPNNVGRLYYQRTASPLWAIADVVAEVLLQPPATEETG